jgi:hypothetical protein
VDVLFSCLFTVLAAFQLASSASVLSSASMAMPWVMHVLCAGVPAVMAMHSPHWCVFIHLQNQLKCSMCHRLCCNSFSQE